VCVVLLYRVQGDVADVARVAALQPCEENPESAIVHCPGHRPCLSVQPEGKPRAAPGGKTPLCLGYRLLRIKQQLERTNG